MVTPAKFKLEVAGAGKPGGANPGTAMPPSCCLMLMGAVDAFIVVASGTETGRCGAMRPVLVVVVVTVGSTWAVEPMVMPTGSVIITFL